jgi:ABC-2 type transport system permease protein
MLALTLANFKMMARNRHTLFWALFFPLLFVVVFGAFDVGAPGSSTLAVIDEADNPASQLLREKLANIRVLELVYPLPKPETARRQIDDGELDYLAVIPAGFPLPDAPPVALAYDAARQPGSQLVESAVRELVAEVTATTPSGDPQVRTQPKPSGGETSHLAAGGDGRVGVVAQGFPGTRVSYFDLVLTGVVGLGVMANSIISIAVKISTYRNQAILRRMLTTPLPIWKYFASEITAHLTLALIQAGVILAVGVFVFGGNIYGNILWILVVVLLGSLVFLNIGFILSAWANSPSAASGMGNAIALPMMFFAGTFFSTASLPWILPYLAEALPLTPMLSAMREIALERAALWDVWPQLATLVAWAVVTALAAVKLFRFS